MIEMRIGERIRLISDRSNEGTSITLDGRAVGLIQRFGIEFNVDANPALECDIFSHEALSDATTTEFILEASRCGFVVNVKTIEDLFERT